jgi:hypothetical protein
MFVDKLTTGESLSDGIGELLGDGLWLMEEYLSAQGAEFN